MVDRFGREWNPEANAYMRFGLVSGLTVIDAEDSHLGRERWSYPLLADELRRWSVKSNDDRRELFLRMVFNAMVTNNDDHPRNHALLHTSSGRRPSPAYDILPVPLVSVERRDLALEVGQFGRAASLYNIPSGCDAFGLAKDEARALVDAMLAVAHHGVEHRSIETLEQGVLPPSLFRDSPSDAI